jgi:hypothetical protein
MTLFSYVVARDYGFAPNPFNNICSLATCKSDIRYQAQVGDWIVGTGAKKKFNLLGHLIYAMKVSEKLDFDAYWNDPKFRVKKPHMNGSRKNAFGDNIYHRENNAWQQANSHHSNYDGTINDHNLKRDTKHPQVLISDHFYYLGQKHEKLPDELLVICKKGQGYKRTHEACVVQSFINWVEESFSPGLIGLPLQFEKFERYDGIS